MSNLSNNSNENNSVSTIDTILHTQKVKTVQEHILAELHEYKALKREDNIYTLDQQAKELLDHSIANMDAPFSIVMTRSALEILKELAGVNKPSPETYFNNMFEPINTISGEYYLSIIPLRIDKKRKYVMITPKIIDIYVKKSFKDSTERN